MPAHPVSALQAVRSYFQALSWASNVPGMQAGNGDTAYAEAYGYLHPDWRAQLPFDRFVASWRGVGHIDLLQVVDAGRAGPGSRAERVYVEVREYLVMEKLQVVAFADGFFTAAPTATGWLLTGGQLRPEDVVTSAFGGPAWWRDPAAVAGMYVSAQTKQTPSPGRVQQSGHTAVVDERLPAAGGAARTLRVHLAQRVDGTWVPLYATAQ